MPDTIPRLQLYPNGVGCGSWEHRRRELRLDVLQLAALLRVRDGLEDLRHAVEGDGGPERHAREKLARNLRRVRKNTKALLQYQKVTNNILSPVKAT